MAGDATFYNLAFAEAGYPRDKWEFQLTVSALAKLDTVETRGIEIGSGFGHFLDLVSPRFLSKDRLMAIEYGDAGSRRLVAAGYDVVNSDIRSNAFSDLEFTFDFVFMFQVLEHMDNLVALADRLRLITSPGAHIFVAVPNPEWIGFNERHNSLLDMPPNHIGLWSRQSLNHFGLRIGCQMVDFQVESADWREFARQDLLYSHMKRSQRRGSLANRVRSRPRGRSRKIAEMTLALTALPLRVPHWLAAARSDTKLGGSLWAHFRKT